MLVLIKDRFSNHIEQLRIIFGRLHASGLKFIAPKFSFWLKDIPSLGYFITQKNIKPDLKTLQGIIYL